MSYADVRHHYEEPEEVDDRPHWHVSDPEHNVDAGLVWEARSLPWFLGLMRAECDTRSVTVRRCWGGRGC